MELLAAALVLALAGVTWWALALRRRLSDVLRDLPPAGRQPERGPSQAMFDAATAAIDSGLILLDGERRVRFLNRQAAELLGLDGGAHEGQGLISLLRDYQVDTLAADVMLDGEPRDLVLQAAPAGRTLRLRASRFASDGTPGLSLLIRDVTQLSMLERARRDMVANVSHELRTPLASVKLLVETLQTEPPPAVARRMLSQTAQEIDAITQLVDELHQLSQIESGRVALQLAPADLAAVVGRAVERIRPQAERKSLALQADVPDELPAALIDADRVGQVLLNLLHNAAKFTPEGGRVTVGVVLVEIAEDQPHLGFVERRIGEVAWDGGADRRVASVPLAQQGRPAVPVPLGHAPGAWLAVSVADTGVGVPPQDLPRIFERFYKVDRARTRNSGGTGLGLAIAKHLVEGHGGRIWAASREGHGSTFSFTLPVVEP